ncbi:unnamed protein product, partial [Rotaria sp. Silwood1]
NLQCYEYLVTLYQYSSDRSIEYYQKMIELCLKYCSNDLENLIIDYKDMIQTYKQQQSIKIVNSEDISTLVCTSNNHIEVSLIETSMIPPVTPMPAPLTPIISSISGRLFENIKHLHFTFDFYNKWIDLRFEHELDLQKKMIYYHMKLTALYYDQEKSIEAKHSLGEVILLYRKTGSEMKEIIKNLS